MKLYDTKMEKIYEGASIDLKISERVRKLKEQLRGPSLCSERARLLTESYKETEGEAISIRMAKALVNIFKKQTINIYDGELIVGNLASKPRASCVLPEYSAKWYYDEIDDFNTRDYDRFNVLEGVKKELREILPYWFDKTIEVNALANMPDLTAELTKKARVFDADLFLKYGIGHLIPQYENVIKKGLKGMITEACERIEVYGNNPADAKKIPFLKAVIIACKGLICLGHRFADLAKEKSERESDLARKRELDKIADVCAHVPANPARDFHEALQSMWFAHLAILQEVGCISAISPGRIDQYFYPYFKSDMIEGKLSRDEALELIECLWIKFVENGAVQLLDNKAAKYHAGFPISQNITLGGINENNNDSTNELSYICLEATAAVGLTQPNLSVRINQKSPLKFLNQVSEVLIHGVTMPELFNDSVTIPALIERGISFKDARNYALVGCVEPTTHGDTMGLTNSAWFNTTKCLELALNNGVDRLTKEQIGPKTGDPREFSSIEDVILAYKEQIEYFVRYMVTAINAIEDAHRKLRPTPFQSAMVDDCIYSGKDLLEGGAKRNITGCQGVGLGTTGSSIAVIDYVIFKKKLATMDELVRALDANFEGYNELRQELINAPKYGNDNDVADEFVREAASIYSNSVRKHKNPRGGNYYPGHFSTSSHIPLGELCGATPDGRLAGEAISEGISPVQGTDRLGPTATIKSVSKVDHQLASNGTMLNLRFNPKIFKN